MIPYPQLQSFYRELDKRASAGAAAATADLLSKHWKPLAIAGGSVIGYKKLEAETDKYKLGRQMYAQQQG
jgi:hypothetical protein